MIPFLDLHRTHEPLLAEFLESLKSIVTRSAFINAEEVKEFEEAFAQYAGTKYCVGLSSGLDAEIIGLRTLGIKPGDKVIVPAMTFVATVSAVKLAGGIPLLVDVDESGLMDLNQAEKYLAKKEAKLVLPVHLFGQMISPSALKTLIQKYSALVLGDACQAHGARLGGDTSGNLGLAAAFSFYPGKNLGALGDGGALCTDSHSIFETAKALREHGQVSKNNHPFIGYTARLDNLQAAFLKTKLRGMGEATKNRIEAAKYYSTHLENSESLKLQSTCSTGEHVYHLYVILTEKRNALIEEFHKQEIGFGLHYPNPIHHLPCFREEPWTKGQFPNAERYAEQGISIPIFPGITQKEQNQVIQAIQRICQ